MHGYPQFSFWNSKYLAKPLLFPNSYKPRITIFVLVSTVLKIFINFHQYSLRPQIISDPECWPGDGIRTHDLPHCSLESYQLNQPGGGTTWDKKTKRLFKKSRGQLQFHSNQFRLHKSPTHYPLRSH